MSALTSTTSSTMLLTLIKYSRDPNIINNENFFTVQQNIASNSLIGRGMIWEYIKENWGELKERFGLNDRRLGNYVKSVTSGFGTALRLQEMEDFFNREPDAGAGTSARLSALEAVKKNIEVSFSLSFYHLSSCFLCVLYLFSGPLLTSQKFQLHSVLEIRLLSHGSIGVWTNLCVHQSTKFSSTSTLMRRNLMETCLLP